MQRDDVIKEVFWLRALACLAVTLVHAISNGYNIYMDTTIYHIGIYFINMSIFFGVPVFVFISEWILANKYLHQIPAGFIKKRVRILVIPYLFLSLIFALLQVDTWTFRALTFELAGNIFLGKTAVYFILIIFQFYFLHIFFRRYLNRLSAKVVIPIAFIINLIYLSIFNFIEQPKGIIAEYIWGPGYWMPFVGWIFYFVLGFYCGRNYQGIVKLAQKKWMLIMPVFTFIILLLMNKYFALDYNSKRVDMLLYSTSIIFLIMHMSFKFKEVPRFILFISNYSFSIFLLNQVFYTLLLKIQPPSFLNILTYSIIVFFITLFLCIITTYVFNQFRFGKYFVGKIMQFNLKNNKTSHHLVQKQSFVTEKK